MKSQFQDLKTVIPSSQSFIVCETHPFFPDSLVFSLEYIETLDIPEDIIESAVVIGDGIFVMQNNIIPSPINKLTLTPTGTPT